jgi:hypothetical protein
MLRMFHYTVWQRPQLDSETLAETRGRILHNRRLAAEMAEILRFNRDHLSFLDEPVDVGFESPLDLHCAYTRDQVLAAIDFYTDHRRPEMREGVLRVADKNLDILFVTLNKSEKDYSPTTMYQDHAISEVLFHWQSQSTTSSDSNTGQRYIQHAEAGSRILLFVRQDKRDASGAPPYVFLGTANYVSHQGSRPMSITWRLDRPMPPELFSESSMVAV